MRIAGLGPGRLTGSRWGLSWKQQEERDAAGIFPMPIHPIGTLLYARIATRSVAV
jgi:hypothetical protein